MLYNRRFIFIHIPGTGGTSLEYAFANCYDVTKDVNHNKHIMAEDMRDLVGVEWWDEAYKFTVIRDPWCIILSNYRRMVELHSLRQTFGEWVEDVLEGIIHQDFLALYCRQPGFYTTYCTNDVVPLTLSQAYARLCDLTDTSPTLPHVGVTDESIEIDVSYRDKVLSHCSGDVDMLENL